ncbi:MAG: hypothetical protein ACRDKY_04045 [Solirubrobacteraceae bacterium]
MDQVSRPMLIALAATVLLAAVWLVALRPKPVAVENTPAASTKEIPAAKQAGAASDAANAKLQTATEAAGQRTPATPAASTPSASKSQAPAPAKSSAGAAVQRGETAKERAVMREVSQGKVVVMLFWSADSADDIATRGAVRSLNTRNGKVKVHVIPIARVGDYGSITRGVKIAQSPTTLIIGEKGQTRTIVGLSEPHELSQAVGDALAGD